MRVGVCFVAIIVLILMAGVFTAGLNYCVYHEIQKRLEIRITGDFVPGVFQTSFAVRRGSFSWEDKVRLLEGNVDVWFDIRTLFSEKGIRIVVESSDARIKFLGSWAIQEGIEDATVEFLRTDVVLGRRQLTMINGIEARSPSFQFSVRNVQDGR